MELDFNNSIFWVLEIGGVDVWITETVVFTWVIMAALIFFAIIVRAKLSGFKEVPNSRFQNVVEAIIETFDNFVKGTAGPRLSFLGNWYFMVFSFLLISNMSGMIPGIRPPTADWSMTFALALSTFILIQAIGLKYQKGGYIKSVLLSPNPAFLPLNLIGELARPISLSFRMFGNILAGMILMTLMYNLAPLPVRFVFPVALHIFFDLATAAIQTYIFCALSLSFIGTASGLEAD